MPNLALQWTLRKRYVPEPCGQTGSVKTIYRSFPHRLQHIKHHHQLRLRISSQ
jgi:hypothetical protein